MTVGHSRPDQANHSGENVMPTPRTYVMVPVDADTVVAGAREIKYALSAKIGRSGLGDEIQVIETGSFGPIDAGVVVAVQPDGVVYGNVTAERVPEIVEEHLLKGRPIKSLVLEGETPVPVPESTDPRHTQFQGRIVLDNCGRIDPESIEEYIGNDGYFALGQAVSEMTPADVLKCVSDSGLRGRGGAGFPTGMKWGS